MSAQSSTTADDFRFRRIGRRWLIEGPAFDVGEVVVISKRGGSTTEQRITSTVEHDGVTYGVGEDIEDEAAAPRVPVKIPYEARDIRARAKQLGARWDAARKMWMVPAEHATEIQEAAGAPKAERALVEGEKRWFTSFYFEVPEWLSRTVGGIGRHPKSGELWTTVSCWQGRQYDDECDEWLDGCTIIARPSEASEVGPFIKKELDRLRKELVDAERELRFQELADRFTGPTIDVGAYDNGKQHWLVAKHGVGRAFTAVVQIQEVDGIEVAALVFDDWDVTDLDKRARTAALTPELLAEVQAVSTDPGHDPHYRGAAEIEERIARLCALTEKREAQLAEARATAA